VEGAHGRLAASAIQDAKETLAASAIQDAKETLACQAKAIRWNKTKNKTVFFIAR
jgi:hypothetical protein